jgi:hypothetical protein
MLFPGFTVAVPVMLTVPCNLESAFRVARDRAQAESSCSGSCPLPVRRKDVLPSADASAALVRFPVSFTKSLGYFHHFLIGRIPADACYFFELVLGIDLGVKRNDVDPVLTIDHKVFVRFWGCDMHFSGLKHNQATICLNPGKDKIPSSAVILNQLFVRHLIHAGDVSVDPGGL